MNDAKSKADVSRSPDASEGKPGGSEPGGSERRAERRAGPSDGASKAKEKRAAAAPAWHKARHPARGPRRLAPPRAGRRASRYAALQALEAVVDDHLTHHVDNAAAAAEVQRLNGDRARLARSLDEAEARAGRLDETNREVSRRLVGAMEAIRTFVEKAVGAGAWPRWRCR